MQELGAEQLGIREGRVLPPISDERLAETERELSTSLPPDYREFVRDYGFYGVDTPTFLIRGKTTGDRIGDVSDFRGISQIPFFRDTDIISHRQTLVENIEEWSSDWIPIANAGNCTIALAISGTHYGKVFFFETSSGEHYDIADSFDEFMSLLTPAET